MGLVNPDAKEPALDYIIRDPLSNEHFLEHKKTGTLIHNYEKEMRRRKLTVKLKNAIMVVWLEVKEARSKPSMEEIIRGLIKKKKEEGHDEKAIASYLKAIELGGAPPAVHRELGLIYWDKGQIEDA